MTVRVTTLKGADAGRYYTERLPSYYLDGDEPPGRWWGKGAGLLGLDGDVDPEGFLRVMAGRDPITGLELGRRYWEGSVRGFDATFSAPKSVSVLYALGGEEVRDRVVESHDRTVDAVLSWVESHAHTRMRRHGHVMTVDAEGMVVGGVSSAHQSHPGSAASYSCGDRQQGAWSGRQMAGVGRSPPHLRPADPVCAPPRC